MPDSVNALGTALRRAATDPSARPDFYAALMDATVYVIGTAGHGGGMLEAGEKVSIMSFTRDDGQPFIPFFTSVDSLRDAITEQTKYLALPARSLFEITRGATLVLDPRSDYGKEFLPNEVEALLEGGVNMLPQTHVTQAPTQVLLAQPAEYPQRMVDALRALFATRPAVARAWLTLMHDPSRDDRPHLVVGMQCDGEAETAIREAGAVAADTAPGGEPVDLFRVVTGDEGLSSYFERELAPFYARRAA